MTATDLVISGVPQEVAAAIREAYIEENGQRLPELVLAKAEAGDERLRGYFEWDDSTAGRQHRLNQAAQLVRRVKVTVLQSAEAPPIQVRAYLARKELPSTEENIEAGAYIAIEQVAGRTAYEASVQDSIKRDLLRLERKYRDTSLLFSMAEEVFSA
jgi:hypothetical protein